MTDSAEQPNSDRLDRIEAILLQVAQHARGAFAVIMTKNSDFVDFACRLGTPPQMLWITCGNVTNRNLRQILTATFPDALS